MSKKKNKNKKYVKALIQNYIELQKYLPMREKYMEHQRQLMEEIKKDLKRWQTEKSINTVNLSNRLIKRKTQNNSII